MNRLQAAARRAVHGCGGTDSPVAADELSTKKLVQIPMLVGGVMAAVKAHGRSR